MAIKNQALLAIVTIILIVMHLHQVFDNELPRDEKALRKHAKRHAIRILTAPIAPTGRRHCTALRPSSADTGRV